MSAARYSKADALSALTHVNNGSPNETAKVIRSMLENDTVVSSAAIADIATDANGTAIAEAVNGILAALRAQKIIET